MVRRFMLAKARGIRIDWKETFSTSSCQDQTMAGGLGIWLGVDAKSVSHLHKLVRPAEHQPTVWTANGSTHVRSDFPLWIEPLKEVCNPCAMTGSPNVRSMGRRCIDPGYEPLGLHTTRNLSSLRLRGRPTLEVDNGVPFLPINA